MPWEPGARLACGVAGRRAAWYVWAVLITRPSMVESAGSAVGRPRFRTVSATWARAERPTPRHHPTSRPSSGHGRATSHGACGEVPQGAPCVARLRGGACAGKSLREISCGLIPIRAHLESGWVIPGSGTCTCGVWCAWRAARGGSGSRAEGACCSPLNAFRGLRGERRRRRSQDASVHAIRMPKAKWSPAPGKKVAE